MDWAAIVEGVPFLRALPPADAERLRPYATERHYWRGEPIWACGQPSSEFTFVARGRVKLQKPREAGGQVIVGICGPGSLLCASAVCAVAPHCCSAVALEDGVSVVALPRRDLAALLELSTAASQAFLREVTTRELTLGQRIEELSSGTVERRLAALLLRLAEQLGVAREGGETWIGLRLSRQELADLAGTTLESATRVMVRFGREGLVQTTPRGFVVPSRPALERRVHGQAAG